jgi:hypothetical protein
MNEEYGSPEGNLPFDLKHRRWPLRYKAASNLNKSQLAAISSKFASEIKSAIKAILRQNGAKISQEQIGEHDRQLFTLFLKDFPSQGRATIFLRDHDIGGRFRSSDLNEIYDFLHTWNNAEHEFNNPELEKKRQALWDALNMFSQELGQHTSMTHRDGWLSIDLRDFEDRPEGSKFGIISMLLRQKHIKPIKTLSEWVNDIFNERRYANNSFGRSANSAIFIHEA